MENEPISEAAPKSESKGFQDNLQRNVHEIEDSVQATRDRVHELNEQAVRFIQERPAAAIGIAFGVGYIVGKLAAKRWLA